jgi:hypothetical protein
MDRGDTVVYEFENERASIEYSKGPCSLKFSQWNVPRETVISIWVTPKTDLNIKDLGLGRSYKMVRDENRLEVIHYIDEEAGIEYNVDEASGIVGLIKYRPTAGDKTLRCLSRRKKVNRRGRLTGTVAFPGAAKEWGGILPVHSTRADVERLFGSKVVRCGASACIYDVGEEIIFFLYATDSYCKNDDATTAWKVPVNTVIEIGVRFKEEKLLSELPFDLSKFERVEDQHLPGWIYYMNVDEGVRVEGGLKTASSVTYFQNAKDNSLRCKSDKNVKPR